DHRVLGLRLLRLLLDRHNPPSLEDRHAEALGIGHLLQQDPGSLLLLPEAVDRLADVPLADVVPEDHDDLVAVREVAGEGPRVGGRVLLVVLVRGWSRLPRPPARMTPFTLTSPSVTSRRVRPGRADRRGTRRADRNGTARSGDSA